MSNIPGTNVSAPVVPFDTADTFPTHDAQYGKGGYRSVATAALRDAIPDARKTEGMRVRVTADPTPSNNGDWDWFGGIWLASLAGVPDSVASTTVAAINVLKQAATDSASASEVSRQASGISATASEESWQASLTQAGISTTQAGLAATAKTAAEAARDASFVTGPKYATEAQGRAAVADGINFMVQGSGDVAAYEYRRTDSAASVLIASYPSASAVLANKIKLDAAPTLVPGLNLLDPATAAADAILLSSGAKSTQANWTTSDFIPVTAASQISINTQRYCAEYDQNKTFVAGTFHDTGGSAQRTFTTNVNTRYLRVTHLTSAAATTQVEYGAASTSFTPFRAQLRDNLGRMVAGDREYGTATYTPKSDLVYETTNLVKGVTLGVFLSSTGTTAQAGWATTDHIAVTAATAYTISRVRFVGFYDANKALLGELVDLVALNHTVQTPADAAFMRITSYQSHWESGSFWVNQGTALVPPITNLLVFGHGRVPVLASALRAWLRTEAFTVTSQIVRNQHERPVSPLNISWPDAATGVLTIVYNTDGSLSSMSATHIMNGVVRTVAQPQITYANGNPVSTPVITVNVN